jgi:hypothetical protein
MENHPKAIDNTFTLVDAVSKATNDNIVTSDEIQEQESGPGGEDWDHKDDYEQGQQHVDGDSTGLGTSHPPQKSDRSFFPWRAVSSTSGVQSGGGSGSGLDAMADTGVGDNRDTSKPALQSQSNPNLSENMGCDNGGVENSTSGRFTANHCAPLTNRDLEKSLKNHDGITTSPAEGSMV